MPDPASLTERLDRLLPQTQCGQCGFDGCRPYAEAMARGEAGVERCPPV
ncbi:RnfABCDGE type electron transport complex subunit B, partial [Xanthomonas sp. Kuri4-2]